MDATEVEAAKKAREHDRQMNEIYRKHEIEMRKIDLTNHFVSKAVDLAMNFLFWGVIITLISVNIQKIIPLIK